MQAPQRTAQYPKVVCADRVRAVQGPAALAVERVPVVPNPLILIVGDVGILVQEPRSEVGRGVVRSVSGSS